MPAKVPSVALPKPRTIARSQAHLGLLLVPSPRLRAKSPDSLNNFILLFPGGKAGVGGDASFSLPSWDFINCPFWLLDFCSVNICPGEEESVLTFEGKEEASYEMRTDPLIL